MNFHLKQLCDTQRENAVALYDCMSDNVPMGDPVIVCTTTLKQFTAFVLTN